MSFDPKECWDCPAPLIQTLLAIGVGLAAVWIGLLLLNRGTSASRILGSVILGISFCGYLFVSGGILRFGVLWSTGQYPPRSLEELRISRLGDLILLVVWYVTTAAIFWWRRKRRLAVA